MTDKEHSDIYIAAAVGGLGLILIYLYMHSSSQAASPAQASQTPVVAATEPAGVSTPYNYNVAPYDPGPPIVFAAAPLPPPQPGANIGGGCCNDCGPANADHFNNTNVAQFATLLGLGTG